MSKEVDGYEGSCAGRDRSPNIPADYDGVCRAFWSKRRVSVGKSMRKVRCLRREGCRLSRVVALLVPLVWLATRFAKM